jgi:hypothetical protein
MKLNEKKQLINLNMLKLNIIKLKPENKKQTSKNNFVILLACKIKPKQIH